MSSFPFVKLFSFGLELFLLEGWGRALRVTKLTRDSQGLSSRRLLSGTNYPQVAASSPGIQASWVIIPHFSIPTTTTTHSPASMPSQAIHQAGCGWNCLCSLSVYSLGQMELVSPGEVAPHLFTLSSVYFWTLRFLCLEFDLSLFYTLLSLLSIFGPSFQLLGCIWLCSLF